MIRVIKAFIVFFLVLLVLDGTLALYNHAFKHDTLEAIWYLLNAIMDTVFLVMCFLWLDEKLMEEAPSPPHGMTRQEFDEWWKHNRQPREDYPNVRV